MENVRINRNSAQVPISVKIGYGLGGAGDSIPYNLFFTYFLFFLTDVAKVNPAIAGTISFIAILWDAVTAPIAGFLSDKSKNPRGRRRPWMFRSIWPLAIIVFLMFLPNEFTGLGQSIYYLLMAVLMWTFYTTYCVPYAALGAEVTHDYNERNTMRMIVGLFSYPFVALCNSGPMWIMTVLVPKGVDIKTCWCISGSLAAAIIILCCLICWFSTRGREDSAADLQREMEKQEKSQGFINTYKDIFRMKAYRNLIFTGLFYIIGYTLFSGIGVYMFTYCAHMTEVQQAAFWSIYTVIALCCTPISIIIANKIGSKKKTLFLFSIMFVINCVVFYFMGLSNFSQVIINGAVVALTTSAFWGLYYSTVYDCAEIDTFINGHHREGSIVACAQFVQKLGGAIATNAVGWLLSAFGYIGAAQQTQTSVHGILLIATLLPALFILISMIIFSKYPVNKKNHDALLEALAKKEAGESYTTKDFTEIL